jgi:hypothetical protein
MTPTTALKYISKVKKHIAALELELACPGLRDSEEGQKSIQELEQLRGLLKQYEDVLKEWKVI